MFLSSLEDAQNYKLVAFYCIFTCVYFPILLSALYFTNYLYSVGKYTFYPVIGVILVAEYTKYLLGTFHLLKKYRGSGGRYEDRFMTKKTSIKSKVKEVMKCCVIILTMIGIYFFIAILFGAQMFNKHEETFMFSAVLCILTIFPPCLNLGSNRVISLLFCVKPAGDIVWELSLYSLQCTLFGAWLGAFVIPLDWDRPWQAWPIPCATGAMIGFISGHIITLVNMLPEFAKKYFNRTGRKVR